MNRTMLGAVALMTLTACGPSDPTGPGEAAVASVSISAQSTDVEEGASLQLVANVSPSGAPQGVTWDTDDVTVALVSASGLVTPVRVGEVTITATSTSDPSRSGSIDIRVTCRNLEQAAVTNGGTVRGDVCFQVLTPLSVDDGTLVVEAGAHISFGPSGSLSIASAGRLIAVGTIDDGITFTSLDPDASWRGIRFDGSASLDNVLEYVTLENGGSDGWSGATSSQAALYLVGDSRLVVQSSGITGSEGTAFTAEEDVELTFSANTISDNAIAGWMHPNAVRGIGDDNLFDGNTDNVIRVAFGNTDRVSVAQTWAYAGVPYEVRVLMFVEAPLTIEPGAILLFGSDVSMIVRNEGSMTAVGLPENPILFSGTESLPGFWKGLQIATVSADNVFDHVLFENGGSDAWTGDGDSRAMVHLSGASRAVITRSTFRGSGHYALWVPADGDIEGLEANVFEANARTIVVHPNRAGAISSDNSFVGNTEQVVRVSFGNNDAVTTAQIWAALEVPYRVTVRTFIRAPLAIDPGAVVEFAQDASLLLRDDGSLNAEGTADRPIVFTGREALAAYWVGIEFATVSVDNVLSHVVLEYAGSEAWFGGDDSVATLHVDADGSLELSDVMIRSTGGYALILGDGGSLTCTNVDDGGFMFYDQATASASSICP